MIPRDDVLRMASEAKLGRLMPAEPGLPGTWWGTNLECLEQFAELLAAHVIARQPTPPMVVGVVSDADLAELKACMSKAQPMSIGVMPPDTALERERAARVAAQSELADLKERLARSGVEQRRAVLAEREACRAECQTLADLLREHNDISGAELAESLAKAISARGAA